MSANTLQLLPEWQCNTKHKWWPICFKIKVPPFQKCRLKLSLLLWRQTVVISVFLHYFSVFGRVTARNVLKALTDDRWSRSRRLYHVQYGEQLLTIVRNLYIGLCVLLIVATRALQQAKKTTALMNSALGPGSRVDISWLNKQITEAERAPSFERPLFGANRESGNEMSIEQPSLHVYSVKALLDPKV